MSVLNFPSEGRPGLHVVGSARRKDGRKFGDHGNRADLLKKRLVVSRLAAAMSEDGRVPASERAWALAVAGIQPRQLQRWIAEIRAGHIDRILEHGEVRPASEIIRLERIKAGERPSRYKEHFENEDILREIASFPTPAEAQEVLKDRPGHPLYGIGRSTFYEHYGRRHSAVRAGTSCALSDSRKNENSLRLTSDGEPLWVIDEFDTKTATRYGGEIISPRMLWIRSHEAGFPEAHIVLPHAARSEDTLSVFGLAVLGGSYELDGKLVEYSGSPTWLGSDQGAALISAEVAEGIAFQGTRPFLGASYTPQHQGVLERMNDVFAKALARRQGSRRAPRNHAGDRYDAGKAEWDDVVGACQDLIDWIRFQLQPQTARHAGRTSAEMKRDLLATGQLQLQQVSDAHLAKLATPAGDRVLNPIKGVRFGKDDYTSVELAQWNEHDTVQISKFHGNDDILFVHDKDGAFIAIAKRYDLLTEDELLLIIEAREKRRQWADETNRERAKNQKAGKTPPTRDGGGMTVTPTHGTAGPGSATNDSDEASGDGDTPPPSDSGAASTVPEPDSTEPTTKRKKRTAKTKPTTATPQPDSATGPDDGITDALARAAEIRRQRQTNQDRDLK